MTLIFFRAFFYFFLCTAGWGVALILCGVFRREKIVSVFLLFPLCITPCTMEDGASFLGGFVENVVAFFLPFPLCTAGWRYDTCWYDSMQLTCDVPFSIFRDTYLLVGTGGISIQRGREKNKMCHTHIHFATVAKCYKIINTW